MYINDLSNATDCFVKLFADDTFLSLSCQKKADLQKKANIEIENIRKWLFANKLTLNVDKSKFMIISRRRDANHSFSLKINGEAVGRCSTYKYLGLIIDDKLDWKSHVNYICKKVSKACGILSKLRHCINLDTLRTVYYALGYSYLRYGNIVWGNCSKTTIKPLAVIQNRIIKIMTFAPFGRIDVDPVYLHLKLLDLNKIHYLEKAKFMFKYHKGSLPACFENYFQNQSRVNHGYNLRNRAINYHTGSQDSQNMMKNNGRAIWDTIPNDIKNSLNIKAFSKKLKTEILLV